MLYQINTRSGRDQTISRAAAVLSFAAVLSACSSTSSTSNQFTPDTTWHSNQLDNGLGYHLYEKKGEPIELRFIVRAGALNESKSQYGYAHFLEHMAFNGTKNYQGNDIVAEFEKAGMSFGADLNAFTSHEVTSYTLSLPDQTSLAIALEWLRDVGDGISFDPNEVEKEKGVVLGELRSYERNEKSVFDQAFDVALGDSLYSTYDVLGTKDSISNIDIAQLKAFYQAWYVPNNTELVVVGDFDKTALVKAIGDEFGSWKKQEVTVIPEPEEIKVWDNEPLLLDAPEGSSSGYGLFSHLRTFQEPDKLSQQEDLYIDLINELISNRLKNRAFEENKLLLDIGAQSFSAYDQQYSVIYADYDEQERLTMQEFMAKELTSLRDYGFVDSELYTVMSQFNSEHANIDLSETNTSSYSIANYKQNTLIDDRIYQDIADYRDNLKVFIDKVTLSDVNKRVNRRLSSELKHIYSASLADDMTKADKQRRLRSYHLPMIAMLEQPGLQTYISSVPSELITPTSHGKVVEQKTLNEKMHFWQLDNGIKVWLKRMPEAEKELYLTYAARGGIMSVDAKYNPALDLALDTFMRSGLGKFNAIEADRFLTENGISLYPMLATSAQGFSMTSNKESLDNAFSALYTAATSLQAQPQQLELVKKNVINNRIQAIKSSSGQLMAAGREALYQPNNYYQLPSLEQINAVSVEEIQALYDTLFRQNYGFDVVIVADMTASELEPYLTRYLANIQYDEKTEMGSQNAKLMVDPKDVRLDISKENSVAYNQFYSSYFVTNSTRELIQLDLIYYLLETRYRNELREKRGLDYTPSVLLSIEDQADIASVVISLNLDTADVEKARKALNETHKELQNGFSQLELDTAKKQVNHSLSLQKDSPYSQLSWHQRAVLYGYDFEIFSHAPELLESISLDEVNKTLGALMGEDATPFVAEMWPKP